MGRVTAAVREYFAPTVPDEIRDEFMLRSASQMQRSARLLFFALMLTTPAAFLAAAQGATWWIRNGAPAALCAFSLIGFLNVQRDLQLDRSIGRATRFVREATFSSAMLAMTCSAWCVYSWLGAPPEDRIYYPIIVALGAFSAAYCVSSARDAAIINLVICLAPMLTLLFTSGYRMDAAVATTIAVAALFHLHMLQSQHANVLDLLRLQRQSRELARTDPLTGLINRRALLDHALDLGQDGELRLILVDIDHFKRINDTCGHDMGDAVLCAVAEILARATAIQGSVARIGGEEFAIVGDPGDLDAALVDQVLGGIRAAAMPHGAQVTASLGIADGPASGDAAWRTLFKRADDALYTAKRSGRNRAEYAPAPDPVPTPEANPHPAAQAPAQAAPQAPAQPAAAAA